MLFYAYYITKKKKFKLFFLLILTIYITNQCLTALKYTYKINRLIFSFMAIYTTYKKQNPYQNDKKSRI